MSHSQKEGSLGGAQGLESKVPALSSGPYVSETNKDKQGIFLKIDKQEILLKNLWPQNSAQEVDDRNHSELI